MFRLPSIAQGALLTLAVAGMLTAACGDDAKSDTKNANKKGSGGSSSGGSSSGGSSSGGSSSKLECDTAPCEQAGGGVLAGMLQPCCINANTCGILDSFGFAGGGCVDMSAMQSDAGFDFDGGGGGEEIVLDPSCPDVTGDNGTTYKGCCHTDGTCGSAGQLRPTCYVYSDLAQYVTFEAPADSTCDYPAETDGGAGGAGGEGGQGGEGGEGGAVTVEDAGTEPDGGS